MVSPSKNAASSNRAAKLGFQCNKIARPTSVRSNRTKEAKLKKKPYTNKTFYLDLKSSKESFRLQNSLQSLGGQVAVFLDRSVTHVVSDRLGTLNSSIASPAASVSPLATPSPGTSERSLFSRRVGFAMLERASQFAAACHADPIQLSHQWKIPVLPIAAIWRDIYRFENSRENRVENSIRLPKEPEHFIKLETVSGTMTRRPYKNSVTSDEDSAIANISTKSSALFNGHGNRLSSHEDLKVQCNGLTSNHRSAKLLSPSGSDVLPLPTQRRSTRRTSASWCGSTRELSQLSPTDSELGVTLRPKGTLWLPVALIGTTAEEHGNGVRPRKKKLSPEEKLLQDNKEYFKMEVLNTKLRSSGSLLNISREPLTQPQIDKIILKKVQCKSKGNKWTKTKESDNEDSVDYESLIVENKIMKINGVKKNPKRGRRSQLMALCDEAESFMFGESSRQSAVSEEDRKDDTSLDSSGWEDSKQRRKRRSHAEAFIHDNMDYYKFETPGTRLRSQGSTCESEKLDDSKSEVDDRSVLFSFEMCPTGEPWYDVYKRQDEGKETHYPVISDPSNQLFLLPYELPRPVHSRHDVGDYYAKRRKRLANILNQNNPRKSPRCHASTLAILSSLKRRKRKSSATDPETSPRKQEDSIPLLPADDDVEELTLLDPEELKSEPSRRRKKTDDRLMLRSVDLDPLIETSKHSCPAVDVLDMIERFRFDRDLVEPNLTASALPESGRSPRKRRKCRKVNRTGWDKAKARKAKRRSRNSGIETVNIVTSPRRPRPSFDEPEITLPPCVVSVRKLKNKAVAEVKQKRFTNRKNSVASDHTWTTRNR